MEKDDFRKVNCPNRSLIMIRYVSKEANSAETEMIAETDCRLKFL